MGKWGSCDFSELEELRDKMELLSGEQSRAFYEDVAKELAARLLSKVIKRTQVGNYPKDSGMDGGTLRRGWTAQTQQEAEGGKKDNVNVQKYVDTLQITKEGDEYVIIITNPVEYASYVEFGHRQEPGRYVPAIGKKLKAFWVEGQFMMTISEKEIDAIAPALLQKRLEQRLREVFK